MIRLPNKDPDEVLDYAIDWTPRLGADVIVSSTWVVPVGLTKESDTHSTTDTTIWLSGGTSGDVYQMTNRVVTSGGRTMEEDRELLVKSVAAATNDLVSLSVVKSALKIESEDWDGLIANMYIPAASKAVIRYLKDKADAILDLDSGGNMPSGFMVPEDVQMATIALIGYWFRSPDSDPDKEFERGFLPRPVTALLYPLRNPALA